MAITCMMIHPNWWPEIAISTEINTSTYMEDTIMDRDNQDQESDDRLDAQREIIRASLDQIAADIGVALRDAALNFPVFLTVPNSGNSLATIATPLDPTDDDWQRASAIVCEIIAREDWLRPVARAGTDLRSS